MDTTRIFSISEMNNHIIEGIAEKLAGFCSSENIKERALPIEQVILKLESKKKVDDVSVIISGNKDKEGLLRYVSVSVTIMFPD